MKTILKNILFCLTAIPSLMSAQIDLTIGLNYSFNPPTNCNNQITSLEVDICNNGSGSAGSFLVGVYLYEPSTQKHWVVAQTTMNSLSGNACVTISNWNIDLNNYPDLPAPGSNYRVGVWADTANVITESNENNNASLLSGNIQVCAATTGIKSQIRSMTNFDLSPNPAQGNCDFVFTLVNTEKMEISILDFTGKIVSYVFKGDLQPGQQKIAVNTNDLMPGIYFASVKTSEGVATRKLLVQK